MPGPTMHVHTHGPAACHPLHCAVAAGQQGEEEREQLRLLASLRITFTSGFLNLTSALVGSLSSSQAPPPPMANSAPPKRALQQQQGQQPPSSSAVGASDGLDGSGASDGAAILPTAPGSIQALPTAAAFTPATFFTDLGFALTSPRSLNLTSPSSLVLWMLSPVRGPARGYELLLKVRKAGVATGVARASRHDRASGRW